MPLLKDPNEYEIHPACAVFPEIKGKEFDDLVGSIRVGGMHEPIKTSGRFIVDGRNRFRAAKKADYALDPLMDFQDVSLYLESRGITLMQYVIDQNMHRRMMTDGEKNFAVGELAKIYSEEGIERRKQQAATGNKGPSGSIEPDGPEPRAAEKAAEVIGTSAMTARRAKKAVTDGIPEVQEAMKAGELSASKAAEIAGLPADQQLQALQEHRDSKANKNGQPKDLGSCKKDWFAAQRKLMKQTGLVRDAAPDPEGYERVTEMIADVYDAFVETWGE